MEFKRIVHPVGASAFITETFSDKDKRVFDVVYDCGHTKSKYCTKHLKGLIDEHFKYDVVIDILFISHFDADHVNGLSYLIEKNHCVQGKTKVYLPLIDDNRIDLYDYLNGTFCRYVLTLLHQKQIQVMFVEPWRKDQNVTLPMKENSVPSGEPIPLSNNQILWKYIPFYIQDNSIIEDFINENYSRFESYGWDKFIEWPKGVKDDLKKRYRKAKSHLYRNADKRVNKINMNSMLLISKRAVALDRVKIIKYNKTYNQLSRKTAAINITDAACLYTSDAGLAEDEFLDIVFDVLAKTDTKKLCLFQIPHHGSYRNYNKRFYDKDRIVFDSLFVNGNPKSSNPAIFIDVINDANINKKILFIVDEDSLEQGVNLDS